MKVFVSSLIGGMEALRDAVEEAVRSLGHEPVRAESFPASPVSPQQACLAGVREADAMVLVLGARYGDPQESGLSATHEEYREARERCPVLVMVQAGVERESREQEFANEVRDWSAGHYTASFTDGDTLRAAVTRALHQLILAQAAGPVEPSEMLERALALIASERGSGTPQLVVAIAGGPAQTILRPSEIEDSALADRLIQEALFGEQRIFDRRQGTHSRVEGHGLTINQDDAWFRLSEDGSILIAVPACRDDDKGASSLLAIVEEDLTDLIERSLRFAASTLESLDGSHRLTHVALSVSLVGGDYLGWQTRAERSGAGSAVSISLGSGSGRVSLSPPHRPRAALALDAQAIAQDLTALLRRQRR